MDALLVADDVSRANLLARAMSEKGFVVDRCTRDDDAVARAEAHRYDLVVLDRTVASMEGLAVCRAIRQASGTSSILVLTAQGMMCEPVSAPHAGPDDYLVNPFDVEDFLARVTALAQRTSGFGAVRCGELALDLENRQATAAGSPLLLTKREYAVLEHLAQRANRVVRRSELLAHVWQMQFDPGSNVVDVHVGRLRKKLGTRSAMIETVWRVGYRLRRPPEV